MWMSAWGTMEDVLPPVRILWGAIHVQGAPHVAHVITGRLQTVCVSVSIHVQGAPPVERVIIGRLQAVCVSVSMRCDAICGHLILSFYLVANFCRSLWFWIGTKAVEDHFHVKFNLEFLDLIFSHLIPSHPISSHPISSHPIPSHLISSHLISSHPIPSHLISSHLISSHSHPIPSLPIQSHLISYGW